MADHFDAPGFSSPAGDPRVDITDHYYFADPHNPRNAVFVLDVNPFATATDFRSDAVYQTTVYLGSLQGDKVIFTYTFTDPDPQTGAQQATVTKTDRRGTQTLISGAPVSFGGTAQVTQGPGGVKFFAGLRSEPFFFDTVAFLSQFAFTNPGTDFFSTHNVFAIVLEVPLTFLGDRGCEIGVETSTYVPATYDTDELMLVDQMGRPLITTFYTSGNDENTINQTPPAQQPQTLTASGQTFLQSFAATLSGWGYSGRAAAGVASWLLPDVLWVNTGLPTHYPNGRALQDDTVDYMLNQLTNGQHPTDYVGPHTDYLSTFPYLGNPH